MSLMRLATASLCGFILLTTSVCAQPPPDCAPDAAGLVATLEKSGFEVIADAVTSSGNFLQIMVDPDSGDFSIIVRLPDGPGCVIHAGRGWARVPLAKDQP